MSEQQAVTEDLMPRFAHVSIIERVASKLALPFRQVAIMIALAEEENQLRNDELWEKMKEGDPERAARLKEAFKAG